MTTTLTDEHGTQLAAPPPRNATPQFTDPALAQRIRRRVAFVWALLFFNVLGFANQPMIVSIPSHVGKALTQGALLCALVLALTINPRGAIRPNLFLGLYSLLAVTSLMMSIRFVSLGTDYRAARLLAFLVVLWLLTPWWGRRDLILFRNHLRVLIIIVGSVALGAVVSYHKAFAFQGRLSGTIWPIPPTQVAHYAAEAAGLTFLLWMCGMIKRRQALLVIVPSIVVLFLSHTRTALIAMVVAAFVASLSLFSSRRRARRALAVTAVVAAVAVVGFLPLISTWVTRGQSTQELLHLSGRTQSWSLVLNNPRPEANKILGSGLSNGSIDGLSIDNSWLATYQDQGIVGDLIDGALFVVLLITALLRPRGPTRAIALFLIVYCLIASFTETGLGGASSYLLDLTVAASLLALPRQSDRSDMLTPDRLTPAA